jgi:hypothetical protein
MEQESQREPEPEPDQYDDDTTRWQCRVVSHRPGRRSYSVCNVTLKASQTMIESEKPMLGSIDMNDVKKNTITIKTDDESTFAIQIPFVSFNIPLQVIYAILGLTTIEDICKSLEQTAPQSQQQYIKAMINFVGKILVQSQDQYTLNYQTVSWRCMKLADCRTSPDDYLRWMALYDGRSELHLNEERVQKSIDLIWKILKHEFFQYLSTNQDKILYLNACVRKLVMMAMNLWTPMSASDPSPISSIEMDYDVRPDLAQHTTNS